MAVLSLNRPEQWNAVNDDMLRNMESIQNQIILEGSIRAVLIKANGSHFSVGMDLNAIKTFGSRFSLNRIAWLQAVYGRWQEMPVPVVAAVQGYCIGSGIEMILGCDIRIAAENARFRLPEVSLGLSRIWVAPV